MPAGSGVIYSESLTPGAAGKLVLTITFSAQGNSGSDWGSGYTTRAFCTQSGVTTYGDQYPLSTTRGSQAIQAVFVVSAGVACDLGIYGTISGAVSASWWDVHIMAELRKR